jgi:hypothetical protein
MSFKVGSPPPPPAPVSPGQSAGQYIREMSDPELQRLIFQAESTYRPQYTALNQRDLYNTLIGVNPGQEGGFYGTLDLADIAARRQATLGQELQSQATQFGLGQLGTYAPQAREAYLAANPQMAAALAQAESLGGRQASGYLNEMGRLAMQAPQTQAISPERVAAMGGFTPQQVAAQQVALGGTMTPERVAAERIAAERVAAGQVQAGQIGAGALGESLYQQALQAQQQSPLSQALQAQGMARAVAPGQLTPEEIRAATQGTREGFAASGRLADNAAIAGEALARAGAARERSVQDIAIAQQINQQLLGAQQQGQALATDVLRADIARQQANVGTALQAGTFNVDAAMRAALANQQTGLSASQANQQAALQAALANQSAANMAQQFNITNAQNVQQMNQAANLQAALANQGVGQRAFEFGAGQNLAAQQFNAQLGMSAAEANRAYQAQQAQQRFANLGAVLGSEQAMLGADRSYALQQAGQQQGITAASLGLIGFGQTPYALGLGAQQQGISASQMGMGPQLFDPSAGINLGLMNAANLGNYQAATYGARAGAQGAMMGGFFQGLGSAAGAAGAAAAGCWVAREVYGEENPKWMLFREWLFSKAPAWFRNLYIKHGERFAEFISNKPKLKSLIRRWMDSRISYNFA